MATMIPLIAQGIGGLLGQLFGGPNKQQQQLLNTAVAGQQTGLQDVQRGTQALQSPLDYWQRILGGSRQAALNAVAPTVQGAVERMNAGQQSAGNLASRSGGAMATLDPYAKANVATNILQSAQPSAAEGVAGIGKTLAGTGASMFGTGGEEGSNLLNAGLNQQKFQAQQGAGLGSWLYNLTKQMPWVKNAGQGGGGGGSTSSGGISV